MDKVEKKKSKKIKIRKKYLSKSSISSQSYKSSLLPVYTQFPWDKIKRVKTYDCTLGTPSVFEPPKIEKVPSMKISEQSFKKLSQHLPSKYRSRKRFLRIYKDKGTWWINCCWCCLCTCI